MGERVRHILHWRCTACAALYALYNPGNSDIPLKVGKYLGGVFLATLLSNKVGKYLILDPSSPHPCFLAYIFSINHCISSHPARAYFRILAGRSRSMGRIFQNHFIEGMRLKGELVVCLHKLNCQARVRIPNQFWHSKIPPKVYLSIINHNIPYFILFNL